VTYVGDAPELQLRGITKRFGPTVANDGIDLAVSRGEIHALMGENGAGKSTLMSILYGVLQPDDGSIVIRGEERHFRSPLDAIAAGLGMVFQSFEVFPSLTVAENVIYGQEPHGRGVIDRRAAEERVAALAAKYGLAVDPRATVDSLPVGVVQRVEILKALYRDASILILDEPTAVLTPQECDRFFDVLRSLSADGRTIIFVTHKLGEALAISGRITVLRAGRVVASLTSADSSPDEIGRAMTGRVVDLRVPPPSRAPGEPVLQCEGLSVQTDDGRVAVDRATFTVRAGEVVGIAGVAGNGQTELVEAICGLRLIADGSLLIGGAAANDLDVAARRGAGLSYIPEDRHATGTAASASVALNAAMGYHRTPPLAGRYLLHGGAMVAFAQRLIGEYEIKAEGPASSVASLSGGNVQKLVVARELEHAAPLLVAEQPTRGVDIGASEFIHHRVAGYRDRGGAVLLVSYELSELLNLASRILVMYRGSIVADLRTADTDEARLGLLMAGHRPGAADAAEVVEA
jgi:general nucleoside transport system ATP-binding protein